MDRGAWGATVHGVAKSWTRLSDQRMIGVTGGESPKTPLYRKKEPGNPSALLEINMLKIPEAEDKTNVKRCS